MRAAGGSIRELPRSKRDGSRRWEIRVYVGRDAEGKIVHTSQVVRAERKADAIDALQRLAQEARDGQRVGTTATVGKLLDEWLANLERVGRSRSTMETYKLHIEKHIRPALGSQRLDKLTAHDVDRYLGELANKGLSSRTVRLDHAVLRGALTQAVDWGWLKANPAKRARLKAPNTEAASITVEQLRTLYMAALGDDPDMAFAIVLGAITGCRRGELCGLQWDDLERVRACLTVERAWVPVSGGQRLTTTKTGKGRKVYVGAAGVALLDGYRQLLRERIEAEPDGWLLSYDGGETPMRAKSMTEYFGRLAKKVDVRAHFHTLRHFAATELVAQGVDLPTAAAQLGHTTGVMADHYLHADDDRAVAAGQLVAGVVERALTTAE